MACATCAKKKPNSYQDLKLIENPPYRATDIVIYDIQTDAIKRFETADWNTNIINVLVLFPTIESISELNFLPQDGVQYTYLTNQSLLLIRDYIQNNGITLSLDRIFNSYLLVSRLNLLHNGSTKKAVVYIMPDGDMVKHEYFYNNPFDYAVIRDFLGNYNDNH